MTNSADCKGLGVWVWQLKRNPQMIHNLKRMGASWVTIKSGDSDLNGQITTALIADVHAAGLGIYSWHYSIPGTEQRQIAQIKQLYDMGVDGHFIDAEIEWESTTQPGYRISCDHRAEAGDFAQKLRAIIGNDKWLAHAPWWKPSAHPVFPWKEFGSITNAQCPQVYWTMLSTGHRASAMLAESSADWQKLDPSARGNVCPIGSVFNGDHANGVANGQNVLWSDVRDFLDTTAHLPLVSLYAMDSCPPEIFRNLCVRHAQTLLGVAADGIEGPLTDQAVKDHGFSTLDNLLDSL